MATKVFSGALVTLDTAFSVSGTATWVTAASVWDATSDVNGDTGTVTNGAGVVDGIHVNPALVDDATIPAAIRVISIQVEFDWHVVNAGGGSLGGPNADSFIVFGGSVQQTANSDTTGHFDYTYTNPRTQLYGGVSATRADLFSLVYGGVFTTPQRSGVSTSQFAQSNFTMTVVYVNVGTGSWLIRTAAMTAATGSVDFTTFAPDIAQITGPSTAGTISAPIADTAGAYIYLDGGGSPVAIGGVPSGFTPDDAFYLSMQQGAQLVGDSVEAVLAPLIDALAIGSGGATLQVDFPLTGMTVAEMTALLGETIVATLTAGSDPTVGNLRLYLESDSSLGWDAYLSIGLWGSYTVAAPEVISIHPNRGSVSGGQAVTIHGLGFTGAPSATVGGEAITSFVVVDDETITGVTVAHLSGVVDVVVTGVGTLTNGYTYVLETIQLPPMPTRTPISQGGVQRGIVRRG